MSGETLQYWLLLGIPEPLRAGVGVLHGQALDEAVRTLEDTKGGSDKVVLVGVGTGARPDGLKVPPGRQLFVREVTIRFDWREQVRKTLARRFASLWVDCQEGGSGEQFECGCVLTSPAAAWRPELEAGEAGSVIDTVTVKIEKYVVTVALDSLEPCRVGGARGVRLAVEFRSGQCERCRRVVVVGKPKFGIVRVKDRRDR